MGTPFEVLQRNAQAKAEPRQLKPQLGAHLRLQHVTAPHVRCCCLGVLHIVVKGGGSMVGGAGQQLQALTMQLCSKQQLPSALPQPNSLTSRASAAIAASLYCSSCAVV